MPFINSKQCRLFFRLEGSVDKPLLVLVHPLGADHGSWDPQMSSREFQELITRYA